MILDEIDQLLQDESLTPAIISEKTSKNEVIQYLIGDLKEFLKENNQKKENKIRFKFKDQEIIWSDKDWPMPESEEDLKELMSVLLNLGNKLLIETNFYSIPRQKEEVRDGARDQGRARFPSGRREQEAQSAHRCHCH